MTTPYGFTKNWRPPLSRPVSKREQKWSFAVSRRSDRNGIPKDRKSMKRVILAIGLLLAAPALANAAQEVFSGEITSASPSVFTAAQSATVTVRIRSTNGSGNVFIEWDSKPSNWSLAPKNYNPTINQGTYYDYNFTVTPPSGGGSGTIVWKLYDDDW